jgi:hypothetical protein
VLAIKSFNTDDPHNEPLRNTKGLLRLVEKSLMTLPKLNASLNALGFNETGSVLRTKRSLYFEVEIDMTINYLQKSSQTAFRLRTYLLFHNH